MLQQHEHTNKLQLGFFWETMHAPPAYKKELYKIRESLVLVMLFSSYLIMSNIYRYTVNKYNTSD
jgi:hypothetical protein